MSISYTRHNKASEKYHEVKLWGVGVGAGSARGAYLAHGLYTDAALKASTLPFMSQRRADRRGCYGGCIRECCVIQIRQCSTGGQISCVNGKGLGSIYTRATLFGEKKI